MIKGQNISELIIIRDTTSGSIVLWIMLIMLISIYVVYCGTYLLWIKKTELKLNGYKEQLKGKKIPEITRQTEETSKIKKVIVKGETTVKRNNKRRIDEEIDDNGYKKEMLVFNSLKRKRW